MMFVGCLSGQGGREPDDDTVQKALETDDHVDPGPASWLDLLAYRPNGEQVWLPHQAEGLA